MYTGWLSWVSMALVVYAVWRMPKNVYARMSENDAFPRAMGPEAYGCRTRSRG